MTQPSQLEAAQVGSVLLPRRRATVVPKATIDARANASAVLAAYLKCATFRVWGDEGQDRSFQLAAVREEWPEPDVLMVYPSVSIVDLEDIPEQAHALVPTVLEATAGIYGEGTVLFKLGEAAATLQLDFWTDNLPDREAIAAALPGLFAPGEDGARVLLAGHPRYWNRPVRATLLSWRRADLEDDVYPRQRRLIVRLRVEVDVVELRCVPTLAARVELAEVGETTDTTLPATTSTAFEQGC